MYELNKDEQKVMEAALLVSAKTIDKGELKVSDRGDKKQGKHCHNCTGLEYVEGDTGDIGGWCCNIRNYLGLDDEDNHINKLQDKDYRFRGKKCFEDK